MQGRSCAKSFFALAILLGVLGIAHAAPVLEDVAGWDGEIESGTKHGHARITQTATLTTIRQRSNHDIIHWASFNIGVAEEVKFLQPDGGVVLNRINSANGVSQILGKLTSTGNGTVVLVNQAGFHFGSGAVVDVAKLIVSTRGISDANFLGGRWIFDEVSASAASIINDGSIVARTHGLVALIGSNIQNNGLIQANVGAIVLASGNKVTLDLSGDRLINFVVTESLPTGVSDAIKNTGSLIADGGKILVTASAAQNVLDNIINMGGVLQAKSVTESNGEIILSATKGDIVVSGTVDASGLTAGLSGGTVDVFTDRYIHLTSAASLTVSGDIAGGQVSIGGNYHGAGPNVNALGVLTDAGAVINANAITSGNGGKVFVWSDALTQSSTNSFSGSINAKGGATAGNGGFVEIAVHQLSGFVGAINVTAASGLTGTLLLDTVGDLVVQSVATSSVLSVADLIATLANAWVKVETHTSGDVTLASSINWATANALTVSAYRNVTINSGVTLTNTAGANLVLQANNGGAYAVGSSVGVVTQGGTLLMSGGGEVHVFYNPTSYTSPTSYTNTGTDAVLAFMLLNTIADVQLMSTSLSGKYALSKNIDASSASSFVPIGDLSTPFTGILNGNNYVISNLTINLPSNTNVGLFGATSALAKIYNVGVNANVTGGSSVGVLVGNNAGLISLAYSTGLVSASGTNVGGLVGLNSGSITNSYSMANVSGTGTGVGGLVGNNSNIVSTSFSTGWITGTASLGGLIGLNSGVGVTNSYWDKDTSGQLNSAAGVGKITGDLMLQATFSTWDFYGAWGLIGTQSYPYLLSFNFSVPRIISGTLQTADPLAPATIYSVKNLSVNLASNGVLVDTVRTGNNGFFYFLEANGIVDDLDAIIGYVNDGSSNNYKGNVMTLAPLDNASVSDLLIYPNTIYISNNGTFTTSYEVGWPGPFVTAFTKITNTDLLNAINGLSDSNILYSVSSGNVSASNQVNFTTGPLTLYVLTGNLATTNGSITFGGYSSSALNITSGEIPFEAGVQVGTYDMSYTGTRSVKTNASGNITTNSWLLWPVDVCVWTTCSRVTLELTAANNITINAPVLGFAHEVTDFFNVSKGNLTLSAAYTPASITTGPSAIIRVYDFNLTQGRWYQVSSSMPGALYSATLAPGGTTVPPYYFFAYTFSIDSGNLPSPRAEFIRAQGGTGSVADPYLVNDLYSLQGIASDAITLAASYKLNQVIGNFNNVEDGFTGFWNAGAGFIKIGNSTTPFSGNFNGSGDLSYVLGGIVVRQGSLDSVGLFGVNTGTISNLFYIPSRIVGHDNVGTLVGDNRGTISNVWVLSPYIQGNINVGGIVGLNSGTIVDVHTEGGFVTGNAVVGGLVGNNSAGGILNRTLTSSYIVGTTLVGGIAGSNAGLIQNSFWDTSATGLAATGNSVQTGLSSVTGGCFGGSCTFGGTANLSSATPYINAGWDFSPTGIWAILPGNTSYPYQRTFFLATSPAWSGVSPSDVNPPRILSGKVSPATGGIMIASYWEGAFYSPNFQTNADTVELYPPWSGIPTTGLIPADEGNIAMMFSFTGVNGFFYNVNLPGGLPDGQLVVTTVLGGVAEGEQPIAAWPTGGSIAGFSLPVTPVSGAQHIPVFPTVILANIGGVPLTDDDVLFYSLYSVYTQSRIDSSYAAISSTLAAYNAYLTAFYNYFFNYQRDGYWTNEMLEFLMSGDYSFVEEDIYRMLQLEMTMDIETFRKLRIKMGCGG